MTEGSPVAVAHGEVLVTVAPEGVDDAISTVMARHEAELDEALRPLGVELRDLLRPTWMRFVRVGDVEAFRGGGKLLMPDEEAAPVSDAEREGFADALVDEMSRPLLPLADDRPTGGCCGSGEACSSAACTGFDNRVAEPTVRGSHDDRAGAPGSAIGSGDVHPEPRQDAAVFGAPGAPMPGPVFGRGGVRGDDE